MIVCGISSEMGCVHTAWMDPWDSECLFLVMFFVEDSQFGLLPFLQKSFFLLIALLSSIAIFRLCSFGPASRFVCHLSRFLIWEKGRASVTIALACFKCACSTLQPLSYSSDSTQLTTQTLDHHANPWSPQ